MYSRLFVGILLSLLLLGTTGCGVTGGTSSRKVTLNPELTRSPLNQSAQIGTVTANPDAGVNRAIGAYNLGQFDNSDLETLRKSVLRSLPPASPESASVHIVVQHFGLTFTNNRGAGLAIIDWCAADGPTVLVSERFYTAYDTGDKFLGTETIGMVKNRILHASATRIVERTLAATNGLPSPPKPALTFDDPTSANITLPAHMVAAPYPSLVTIAVQQTMLGGMAGATRLLPDTLPAAVDWNTRLSRTSSP